MQDGHVYEPTSLWVPVIGATDGSQLPTPTAQAAKHGATPDVHRNSKLGSNLWDLPHLLPTPQAWDGAWGPDLARVNRPDSGGMDLVTTVTRLLPTPRAQNGEPRNMKPWVRPLDQPQNLENAIARLPGVTMPTPSTDGNGPSDEPPPSP